MSITPWSAVIPVAQTAIQEYFSNSVQLTDGTIVVGFITAPSNDGLFTFNIQRYSDTGVALGGPIATALTAGGGNGWPHLAALTDGGFAVEWFVGFQHIVQEYTAAGVAGTSTNLGISSGGDIATMPSGEYVVSAGSDFQIVAQNGTPYTPVSFGSTFQNTDVAVSATRIGFIRDNNGTTASIVSYDLNGNNLVFGPSGSSGATSIGANAIDVLSTGGFVGVFDQESSLGGSGVRAIKFMTTRPDGSSLLFGETVIVDGLTIIRGLDVKGLSGGGFAITYTTSSTGAEDQQRTFVKMFDRDGHQVGGEFALESPSAGLGAVFPELTSLSDGRLLVTWMEWDNALNNAGVKMQILDPREGYYVGTEAADKIYGHNGNVDIIHGQGGADFIDGLAGADTIYGGDGADTLYGGRGDDTIYGGAGADKLVGGLGDDEIYGGADVDSFYSSAGSDIYDGEAGNDLIYYSSTIVGATVNLSDSTLNAGIASGDTLISIERVSGTNLADNLTGDGAVNQFYGNAGADRLDGGVGADILTGGTGSDSFVFKLGQSGTTAATLDRIADYAKGAVGVGDEIDYGANLSIGGTIAAPTAAQALINAANGVATFFAGSGTTLADALADIATSITTGGNAVGEFAFFQINNSGDSYMFISDGVAGVGANDVLVRMTGITSINTINITAGDVTILT